MNTTYRQLQSTLSVGSRVLINGGNKRHYNKRGYVVELNGTSATVRIDDHAEPVTVCTVDLEVTASEHSRKALVA